MNVYLAARYSRRNELCGYRDQIESLGIYKVTSRWIDGSHRLDAQGLSEMASIKERCRFAKEDLEDVLSADIVISFSEEPRSHNGRGGRHVEFGVALARGKTLLVVGPAENVFHELPIVYRVGQFEDVMQYLRLQIEDGS